MNEELSVLGQCILKLAKNHFARNKELVKSIVWVKGTEEIKHIVLGYLACAVRDLDHPTVFYNNKNERERIFEAFTQYVKGEVNQEKKT